LSTDELENGGDDENTYYDNIIVDNQTLKLHVERNEYSNG
jgi:hypothetical protein